MRVNSIENSRNLPNLVSWSNCSYPVPEMVNPKGEVHPSFDIKGAR